MDRIKLLRDTKKIMGTKKISPFRAHVNRSKSKKAATEGVVGPNFCSRSNRPRSIYQYSNMVPRLSGQTSIFGVVFFVSKSLLGIEGQRKLEKFAILTRKPRSHVGILIYRTWPIRKSSLFTCLCENACYAG